jgi:hypothetical protein
MVKTPGGRCGPPLDEGDPAGSLPLALDADDVLPAVRGGVDRG